MKKLFFLILVLFFTGGCNAVVEWGEIETLKDTHEVTYVFDGDTIEVMIERKKEKVRLIGIDAPETDGPYTKKECHGEEAKHYLTYLLSDTHVFLLPDPTQDDRDTYGRLLRYVFTAQSENVGRLLLEQGYVKEFTFIKDYNFKNNFLAAQKQAQIKQVGLWSPDACK